MKQNKPKRPQPYSKPTRPSAREFDPNDQRRRNEHIAPAPKAVYHRGARIK